MDFAVKTIPPMHVAYIRSLGPYAEVLGPAFGRLCAWAGKRGLFKPGVCTLAVCYDNPRNTPPEQIRSDACIMVDPSVAAEGEIHVQTLAGGKFAVATHHGPYSGLPQAWETVMSKLLPAAGLKMRAAPCFEMYMNDCSQVKPEELRTDIYVAVE